MTDTFFEVTPDPRLLMLRITLRGFWDSRVMASYMKAARQAMADLDQRGGCQYVLIDMSEFAIQPKEIADGHAANLRYVKEGTKAKVALVMQSGPSKLQGARVVAGTGHSTFESESAAMAWLLAEAS